MNARLVEFRDLSPNTREFTFETVDDYGDPFDFIPGQFVSLFAERNGRPITRAYSLASPPRGNRFDLCLNLVEQGVLSPWLFELKPGDLVEYKGPFGTFMLKERPQETILVATGTGITPFRSILHHHLSSDPNRKTTLVFGARHEHGLLYSAEFEELERAHAHFRFLPTLTRPGTEWKGRTGRVHDHVLEVVGDKKDVNVYICGLAEMVNGLRNKLKDKGLDRKQIIVEKYD
jgi:CDP-4-dehydro-6-deoxyglucose reductase, E3